MTDTSTSSELNPSAPVQGSVIDTTGSAAASADPVGAASDGTDLVEPSDGAAGSDSADSSDGADSSDAAALAPVPARRSLTERLEREGEIAADYLERLLDVTDLDGDLDVDIDGDRAAVAIVDSEEGRVPRRLVGREGEVLEALQELTRLAVLAATGERSRLMLDVAGHRAARREELIAQAKDAVAQVTADGKPVTLLPMSPFERKVVHDAIAEAGLKSESEGVEPARCVVVLPA